MDVYIFLYIFVVFASFQELGDRTQHLYRSAVGSVQDLVRQADEVYHRVEKKIKKTVRKLIPFRKDERTKNTDDSSDKQIL
jgi:hypothetical protein